MLTWSFCCTILIPVQMRALSSSFKALGDPKTCHSELRVLYCICGTESSWPKASRYHCIPYVMGGGWELCIHIRVVTAPAANRITLPYLTLPYLYFALPCLALPYPTLPYLTVLYPTVPYFYLKLVLNIAIVYYITLD